MDLSPALPPGDELLRQILEPSVEINERYRTCQIRKTDGTCVVGTLVDDDASRLRFDYTQPDKLTTLPRSSIQEMTISKVSTMPDGLLNVLKREDILDLLGRSTSTANNIRRRFRDERDG